LDYIVLENFVREVNLKLFQRLKMTPVAMMKKALKVPWGWLLQKYLLGYANGIQFPEHAHYTIC